MFKKYIKILLFVILSSCCCPSMAQKDTIYRNIKELRIEQKPFLRSLNSASKKDYFCNIGDDAIYTIQVKYTQDSLCIFSIGQYCLQCGMLKKAKGYFMLNGTPYFVLGSDSLSEYPQGLFSFTRNQNVFMDVMVIFAVSQDIWFVQTDFTDCYCGLDFEYRNGKLYFLRDITYVEDSKLPLKEIALPDPSLEKSRKKFFNRRRLTSEFPQ